MLTGSLKQALCDYPSIYSHSLPPTFNPRPTWSTAVDQCPQRPAALPVSAEVVDGDLWELVLDPSQKPLFRGLVLAVSPHLLLVPHGHGDGVVEDQSPHHAQDQLQVTIYYGLRVWSLYVKTCPCSSDWCLLEGCCRIQPPNISGILQPRSQLFPVDVNVSDRILIWTHFQHCDIYHIMPPGAILSRRP